MFFSENHQITKYVFILKNVLKCNQLKNDFLLIKSPKGNKNDGTFLNYCLQWGILSTNI